MIQNLRGLAFLPLTSYDSKPTLSFMKPLRKRRQELGLTQMELAELAGIDQTTISRLELQDDKGGVTLDVAQRLARALDASLDDLFPASLDVGTAS